MKRSTTGLREAVRKSVKKDTKRERLVIDPRTYMKTCSKCTETKLAEENFFKLRSARDGYAYCCKTCWTAPSTNPPKAATPATAPTQVRHVHPASSGSRYAHSRAEEQAVAKECGLPLVGYADVAGSYVPVYGKAEPAFLDRDATRH